MNNFGLVSYGRKYEKKTLSLRIQSPYNELIRGEPFFQYCNLFAKLTHFEAIFAISAVCKIRKSSKKEKIKQIQIFAQSFNLLIRNDTTGTDRQKIMHISFIGTKQPLQVTLSVCLNDMSDMSVSSLGTFLKNVAGYISRYDLKCHAMN